MLPQFILRSLHKGPFLHDRMPSSVKLEALPDHEAGRGPVYSYRGVRIERTRVPLGQDGAWRLMHMSDDTASTIGEIVNLIDRLWDKNLVEAQPNG